MYNAVEFAINLSKGGITMEVDPHIAEIHGLVGIQINVTDVGVGWKEARLAWKDAIPAVLNEWI
jgi:hypothetical protein